MSDINKFDDQIKNSFGDFSPDVAPHIWENIIAKKDRKRPGIFWLKWLTTKNILLLSALLITITAGVIVLNNNQANFVSTDKKNQPISSSTKKENNTTKNAAPINSITNPTLENNAGTETSVVNSTVDIHPAPVSTDNSPVEKNGNTNISIQTNQPKNNLVNTSNKSILKNKIKLAVSAVSASIDEQDENNNIENTKDYTPFNQLVSSMNRLYYDAQKINSTAIYNNNKQQGLIKKLFIPDCPEMEKNAAGNKYYWEIYVSPDFATKQFNDTANSKLVEKRKESNSFQSAYSAGLRYTRVFGNGISLRTGINFSQINEKFSFALSNIVQNTYIIDPVSGDTTGSYTTKGTRYKTTYNHYQTIDIPLLIGYEIGNSRLHVNFNAGALVNIYSWQNGETLDTSFLPVSFSTGKSNSAYQYKSNVGIGFTSAVSFYYKMNDRLHLLAEPYYRYNFSPMNKDNFSIQEKFSTIGLRLGIRVDLK